MPCRRACAHMARLAIAHEGTTRHGQTDGWKRFEEADDRPEAQARLPVSAAHCPSLPYRARSRTHLPDFICLTRQCLAHKSTGKRARHIDLSTQRRPFARPQTSSRCKRRRHARPSASAYDIEISAQAIACSCAFRGWPLVIHRDGYLHVQHCLDHIRPGYRQRISTRISQQHSIGRAGLCSVESIRVPCTGSGIDRCGLFGQLPANPPACLAPHRPTT